MKKYKKSFKKDRTSIIIPLYNEEIRLDYCLDIIEKFLKKNTNFFLKLFLLMMEVPINQKIKYLNL